LAKVNSFAGKGVLMRLFILVSVLIASTLFIAPNADASTQVLFSRDGKKVTVLLAAVTTNPDSISLFDSMNVPVDESQGRRRKSILFTDADGVKSLSVLCVFSKIVPNLGTCTVLLVASRGMVIEPSAKRVVYALEGDTAAKLTALFVAKPGTTELFRSSDEHLVISTVKDESSGEVRSFSVEYQ
jgi:hypothetical protein